MATRRGRRITWSRSDASGVIVWSPASVSIFGTIDSINVYDLTVTFNVIGVATDSIDIHLYVVDMGRTLSSSEEATR